MSLFDNIKITKDEKQSIVKYLLAPTLSDWNNICNIYIFPGRSLWFVVTILYPKYYEQWHKHKMTWKTFPDSIMLGRAIKNSVEIDKKIKEDMLFFPGPSAA